ncbi:gas vesicle protein GvpO [Streptomyces sp. NPDC048636]|uniref:gas vesicle protein GvpO n=1 Tax=Streptomyces sp. NPDC048636 TaxID=3155762 RepID=UPI0034160D31
MTDSTDSHDETRDKKKATDGMTPVALLRSARDQLVELTGLVPEAVPRMERTEDGWALDVEVVELARVPETMSLMALYELTLDPDGVLTGYRRIRRYERGRSDRG